MRTSGDIDRVRALVGEWFLRFLRDED